MTKPTREDVRADLRWMLNKVPEITLYFWVIKVLCTTVGETASDYLSDNVGLGLTKTTFMTGALLVAALVFQFRARRYVPWIYWLGIVLISVVGTQITDNLSDNMGVSLVITTVAFAIALSVTFAVWYASERTLSIHTIYTTRRESFYWLAVLFTFALGTAAGDLTAERLNLGYLVSLVLFAATIGAVGIAHYRFNLNAVASFWIAYVLTRPLGASLGDYLSQPRADGGLGLGTTVTSALFLGAIIAVVAYLSLTRKDATESRYTPQPTHADVLVVAHETAATPALVQAVRERAAARPSRLPSPDSQPRRARRADRGGARAPPGRRRAHARARAPGHPGRGRRRGQRLGFVPARPHGRHRGGAARRRVPRDHPLDAAAQRLQLAPHRPSASRVASRRPGDDGRCAGTVPTAAEHQPAGA